MPSTSAASPPIAHLVNPNPATPPPLSGLLGPPAPPMHAEHDISASDHDSQTWAYLQAGALHPPPTQAHPALIWPPPQHTATPTSSPDTPSIPGYLVADLPKSTALSAFLDRDWCDFIPPSWRRVKHIDKSQPSSLSSLSAIMMAGLGLSA
ncbi:hypothetical protein FOZ62_015337, partial [Perkinsus olseni]